MKLRNEPTHRFEESDELRLVIQAPSFADAVAEAGRALAELGGEPQPSGAPADGWSEINVEAGDRAALLVEWLNELIYRADTEGSLATEFEVLESSSRHLRARVRVRSWPSRSFPVKAATLDRARVDERAGRVTAEVTLDV